MSLFAQCAQLLTGATTNLAPAADTPAGFPAAPTATEHPNLQRDLTNVQCQILARTGQRISIAAARTIVVARTASRLPWPFSDPAGVRSDPAGHGVCVVPSGSEHAFLAPLPLQRLHGLPQASLRLLQASGLVTIGELQRVPKAALQAAFGPSEGLRLWRSARGLDSLPVSRPGFRGRLATRAIANSRTLSTFGNFSASVGPSRIRVLLANIVRRLAF